MTSATRSSSVVPRGSATTLSQPTLPVAAASATRRPPGKPAKTAPRSTMTPAWLRSDSAGVERW